MGRVLTSLAGIAALAATGVHGQAACPTEMNKETAPKLTWQRCAAGGACTPVAGTVTVDANWRWTRSKQGATNCYKGNVWDKGLCPDEDTCTKNCCIEGADYTGTYGITSTADSLTLKLVNNGPYSRNIGSRLYLLDASGKNYEGFKLLGNEFSFDVDTSKLPCGTNGALYFVAMDPDGGQAKYNNAGAARGTGYCDAQCPADLKFVEGKAQSEGWVPSKNDSNSGVGNRAPCCFEMDVFEANSISTAFTAHPCKTAGYTTCSSPNCGGTYSTNRYAGTCDPDGCDFNSFRQGNPDFYGAGPKSVVKTSTKFTVVTQFFEKSGQLAEIKRFYIQDGKVIPNSVSNIKGNAGFSGITPQFCTSQKAAFGDKDIFNDRGGFAATTKGLSMPLTLVMSLWDDHYANMGWLNSAEYPPGSGNKPGSPRGTCLSNSGEPAKVEAEHADSTVTFSNIKFGPIDSTSKLRPA